jgi:hypothetical protein
MHPHPLGMIEVPEFDPLGVDGVGGEDVGTKSVKVSELGQSVVDSLGVVDGVVEDVGTGFVEQLGWMVVVTVVVTGVGLIVLITVEVDGAGWMVLVTVVVDGVALIVLVVLLVIVVVDGLGLIVVLATVLVFVTVFGQAVFVATVTVAVGKIKALA